MSKQFSFLMGDDDSDNSEQESVSTSVQAARSNKNRWSLLNESELDDSVDIQKDDEPLKKSDYLILMKIVWVNLNFLKTEKLNKPLHHPKSQIVFPRIV
jgi:hypothetical protein